MTALKIAMKREGHRPRRKPKGDHIYIRVINEIHGRFVVLDQLESYRTEALFFSPLMLACKVENEQK
jgi:hypothetical protein